jgi:hypothetical protein
MDKDKWIEEVLNSTQNIRRVAPRESLLDAIQYKIRAEKTDAKTVWMVAASVAVLVTLNVAAINFYKQSGSVQELKAVTDNPFTSNNQLY